MKIKRIGVLLVIFCLVSLLVNYKLLHRKLESSGDIIAVNEIVKTYEMHWEELSSDPKIIPNTMNQLDYVVLDLSNHILYQTRENITKDLNTAIGHRDTIVDIRKDTEIVGKVIIYNSEVEKIYLYRNDVFISTSFLTLFIIGMCMWYLIYINKSIIKPFHKLKGFANSVSHGNFDMPLIMDKNNLFGAFTESFDIMREELLIARNNERIANQSKKELIAGLSHDIKTPVASIKAISELMLLRIKNKKSKSIALDFELNRTGYVQLEDKMQEQLEIIGAKADQIDLLISNMFQATLEELKELKVNPTEEFSTIIWELIRSSDYDCKIVECDIPDCIIRCDTLRLQQVFDNIISNSYKYGGNRITVTSEIIKKMLVLTVKDYGEELLEEEVPLMFHKFYRGKNASGKGGSGLGLYISKYFVEQMEGNITCENSKDGLIIKISIKIA